MLKQLVITTALALGCSQMILTAAQARGSGAPEASGFDNKTPNELKDIGIDEHLGSKVNLDLVFKDESGKAVALRSFLLQLPKPLQLSLERIERRIQANETNHRHRIPGCHGQHRAQGNFETRSR